MCCPLTGVYRGGRKNDNGIRKSVWTADVVADTLIGIPGPCYGQRSMTKPSLLPPDRRLIHLAPEDNICAAAATIEPGETLAFEGRAITVADRIPTGHKVAVIPIATGQKVFKYGAPIGSATRSIQPGEHVHTHNLKSDYLPTFARGSETEPSD